MEQAILLKMRLSMKITTVYYGLILIAVILLVVNYAFDAPSITENLGNDTLNNGTGLKDKEIKYILFDDFNKTRLDLWIKSPYVGPHETMFMPELTYVSPYDGYLVLLSDVSKHVGSQYETIDRYFYGKYKARMRICNTPGTTLAFFTYKGPEPSGHNEIDIEFIKRDNNTTAYFATFNHRQVSHYEYNLSFDPGADFHEYGFYWYPDRVEFYIDDMDNPIWTSYQYVPYEPCHLLFNNWVLNSAHQSGEQNNEINIMYVDWVKVEAINETL
jgi:hypothetical protein